MSVARDVANALVQSGFWPGVNPHAVLTLCFLAEAEGHHPAVVYRDYHIMNGKPSKKAEAILRDFAAAGGKIEWHKLDDKCADATFTHPSGQARIEWTLERANKAGLKSPMWNKYPRQMLRSRCISEGVRTVFPGATSGLYETNEVADIVAEERPANDTMPEPEPVAEHVDAPPPEQKAKRENWGGRYPNMSRLHRALCEFEREINSIGDMDMLAAFEAMPEWQEFYETANTHAAHYLFGGNPAPQEFKGLQNMLDELRDEFSLADFIPERNPIAAG